MEKFNVHEGIVLPLDRANVDTDAIIPKQFLKSIKRTGFGPNLFDEWRYLDHGEPDQDNSSRPLNPDFVLNQPRYEGASILLARDNFGCGSSREHAPWALLDYGFRCIIAPSFADIFFNNCFKNGILPVVLDTEAIDSLFIRVEKTPGFSLRVDLPEQTITILEDRSVASFKIDGFQKDALLQGLDDIGMTLAKADLIRNYEETRRKIAPWLFS
ncbi:MAG: 3-isopropylmalate dehydratase small subunit [Gammaproteobacteria bacterium]|nr:3-isopropylmalate dehydratase small subunit [Gammaproteobacteria bacterium]